MFHNTYQGGSSKNKSLIGWLQIHPNLSLLDYFGVFDPDVGVYLTN